jgi:hypothetical protein
MPCFISSGKARVLQYVMQLFQIYIYENLIYVLKVHVGPAMYCGRVRLNVMRCVREFTCISENILGDAILTAIRNISG